MEGRDKIAVRETGLGRLGQRGDEQGRRSNPGGVGQAGLAQASGIRQTGVAQLW